MSYINYKTFQNQRANIFSITRILIVAIGILIISFPPSESSVTLVNYVLLGLGLQGFTTILWLTFFRKEPFNEGVASVIFYSDLFIAFFLEYPLSQTSFLFLLIPSLILVSAALVFQKLFIKRIALVAFTFLTAGTFFFGLKGYFSLPLFNYLAQVLIFSFLAGITSYGKQTIEKLKDDNLRLQEEVKKVKQERETIKQQLAVLKKGSKDLSKNVKRKDIEIQNIITLSEQIHIGKDSKDVLKSFLLTALGQIGSSHGFIMAREKKLHNYWGIVVEKGLRALNTENLKIYLDSNLITILRSFREPIFAREIPQDNLFSDELGFLNNFLDDVFCPIFVKNRIIGLIAFGPKVTERPFTKEDFNLISIVANQSAFVLDQVQQTNEYRDQFSRTIRAMLYAMEAKFMYTRGHILRTTNYVTMAAKRLGFTTTEIQQMGMGSLLHDIGKTAVNDKYLLYDGSLSDSGKDKIVKERILTHAVEGGKILKTAGFNSLMIDMALHHHEYFNGKGFPHRLGGEEIPIQTRILSVCNAYDAMTSERPYRRALSKKEAMEVLVNQAGDQFDPEVVKAFLDVLRHSNKKATFH
ncbi:MAG: HD domain-containing protein [Calditrichaeota bacterium]|nr:HD domain-containing protein [Calditrichota bacterium]